MQIDLLGKLLAEFPDANLAGIAVGNEAISRGDVTEQQLLQYIAQVRAKPREYFFINNYDVTFAICCME
jgi:exo-beta-1,3-glucanase (GH17 family)